MPKRPLDISLIRVFQVALRGRRRKAPLVEGEWEVLQGVDFFIRWGASEEE